MTDAVSLNNSGLTNTTGRIRLIAQGSGCTTGNRTCLGFFGGTSARPYTHVKTSAGGSSDRMHKFEYNGYTYAHLNVHNSVTFYTYNGTATPYVPSLVNWGENTGGIINYYYSSDDYVIIVLQTNGNYTGGFLYHQSGQTHADSAVDVLGYTHHATATTGVY